MAAIFDFNGSGKLARERNLYQGVRDSKKIRKGVGSKYYTYLALPHPFSVNSNSKFNMAG